MYFSFIMMHYAIAPVFVITVGLTSHTCIYDHRGVFSGTARKQVFLTPEGMVPRISTKPFRPSGGGFSDQITSDRV